ncbi:26638_t:CDS:2, partial [Gigaspora margarita]
FQKVNMPNSSFIEKKLESIQPNLQQLIRKLKDKEELIICPNQVILKIGEQEYIKEISELYFQIGELLAKKGWCDTTIKLNVHFSDSKGKLVGRIAKRVYLLFNARGQSNIQSVQAINISVLEHIAEKDFESLLVEAK